MLMASALSGLRSCGFGALFFRRYIIDTARRICSAVTCGNGADAIIDDNTTFRRGEREGVDDKTSCPRRQCL